MLLQNFHFKRLFLLIIDRQASEKKSKLTNKLITTANFIVFVLRTLNSVNISFQLLLFPEHLD
jgi:hypothetical protein